jgi:predicted ATPase with chaperone activity
MDKTRLSMRAQTNLIKVAQTIADLECAPVITLTHLEEAEALMQTPLPKE